MATNIALFPTLNENMMAKIRFQTSEYEFFYVHEDLEYPLNIEEIDGSISNYKIVDNNGIWTPDDFNLGVKRTYSLRTYQGLFGPTGVACKDATLGIAILWTSSSSKQRGVIEVGQFNNSMVDRSFSVNYEFADAQLRGSVDFTTVIYLKDTGMPTREESHLANSFGVVLGELDKFTVILDGSGSVFPIYEIDEPGQPLWKVKCEWDDPSEDLFADTVAIYINRGHRNYKYLDRSKPRIYNEQLLHEIMASALGIIITKLKQDETSWAAITNNEDLQVGSVSEAVSYFITTLEWDVSTPENLSLSIRKFFE